LADQDRASDDGGESSIRGGKGTGSGLAEVLAEEEEEEEEEENHLT
jgi:hypothetical protein